MRKPQRPCREFGCSKLTRETYCEIHKHTGEKIAQEKNQQYNMYNRPKHIDGFYKSTQWVQVRALALVRDNYLCQRCLKSGILQKAQVVHHLVEVKEDWNRRLDVDNLECLCHKCHNQHHKRTAPRG